MSDGIATALLEPFSDFVAGHLGLHFPPDRWPDLQRGIRAATHEFGYADAETCVRWLLSSPLTRQQIDILAGNLTVGETYFFREKATFDAIEQQVLPDLLRARRDGDRRLRLWSAACCTGEEAYSLAILLRRLLPDWREWNVTVLATDVNPRFLHKAAAGVYGDWSFRDAPGWIRDACFTRHESGKHAILPEIRRMVTFEHLNLARDIYPSLLNDTNAMDVILCRNVLMYFEPQRARQAFADLYRCLVDGGWLILSATETSSAFAPDMTPLHVGNAIFYRRQEAAPRMQAKPVAIPAPTLPPPDLALPPLKPPEPDRSRDVAVLTGQARELANQGRLAEALACTDRMVVAAKLNPRTHYLRALILQEQGATHDGIKELQRAVYLDHDFVLAHFALGNLARNAGRMRESGRHFENALRILRQHAQNDVLPESDGLTAGRLAEIIASTLAEDEPA
jgi:chemotaxis protein methyltransferase CheR